MSVQYMAAAAGAVPNQGHWAAQAGTGRVLLAGAGMAWERPGRWQVAWWGSWRHGAGEGGWGDMRAEVVGQVVRPGARWFVPAGGCRLGSRRPSRLASLSVRPSRMARWRLVVERMSLIQQEKAGRRLCTPAVNGVKKQKVCLSQPTHPTSPMPPTKQTLKSCKTCVETLLR